MAALINTNIPAQTYEVIRGQIASVLAVELAKQYTLDATKPNITKVWEERWTPVDGGTEPVLINVKLARADYQNRSQRSVTGVYTYYIDVHTTSKGMNGLPADVAAKILAQRIAGNIRAILVNPLYNTLLFAANIVQRTGIEGFINADNMTVEDALSDVITRMTYIVTASEDTMINNGLAVPLQANNTTVRIEDTDKGFYWIYNQ